MTALVLQMPYLKAIRQGGLDRQLMVAVAVLLSIGLVMISSASVSFADHSYGDAFYFLKRHMMFLVISAVAAFVVVNMPSRFWYRHGFLLLLATLLLLVAVLIPGVGREVNGSQRWIPPWTL